MIFKGNDVKVVDPYVLSDPAIITDYKSPGILDPHVWFYHNGCSDTGSEETQADTFESGSWNPSVFEEQQAQIVPEYTHRNTSPWIKRRIIVRSEISLERGRSDRSRLIVFMAISDRILVIGMPHVHSTAAFQPTTLGAEEWYQSKITFQE